MTTTPRRCPTCGQPMPDDAKQRIRDAIRESIDYLGTTQAALAARVGISEKHLSYVLSGRSGLSFDLAERLLAALGRRLDIGVETFDQPARLPDA